MYLNRPSATSSRHHTHIDHAEYAAGARVDVRALAVSPSICASAAAASFASVAAAAAQATTLTALATAASPSVAAPVTEYAAPLPNDILGVVAGYLPSEDQLTFRTLNTVAKVQTDREMAVLAVTLRQAVALFSDTAGLRSLKRLSLIDCDTTGLIAFVDILENARYAPFELDLMERDQDDALSSEMLQRLASLDLTSLTLRPNAGYDLKRSAMLAEAAYPIIMDLGYVHQARDFDAITRLPTLTSLAMRMNVLSISDAEALGSHASLSTLQASKISTQTFLSILANPRLKALSVSQISVETEEVIEALTNHASITSLQLETINNPALLTAILRNPIISSLTFSTYCLHSSEMQHIVEMPSLRAFTLLAGRNLEDPNADALQALCRRALDTLRFDTVPMNEITFSIAASAHATSLSFNDNEGTFNQSAVAALLANPHVTSLSFQGDMTQGGAAQLATAPRLKALSLHLTSTEETIESVQRAWEDAGKSLVDLTVDIQVPLA